MGWRDDYKIHPAADVFPMMSHEELDALAADIKANGGLTSPISFFVESDGTLTVADGRNRLEALERIGLTLTPCAIERIDPTLIDPVAYIIGKNILRRHLSKQTQADMIVAAHKAAAGARDKPRQGGEVYAKGGRSKVNKVKAAAVAAGKQHGVGKRTIERSFAKSEKPRLKPEFLPAVRVEEPTATFEPLRKDPHDPYVRLLKAFHRAPQAARDRVILDHISRVVSIELARRNYLLVAEQRVEDLDTEQAVISAALREIAGKR